MGSVSDTRRARRHSNRFQRLKSGSARVVFRVAADASFPSPGGFHRRVFTLRNPKTRGKRSEPRRESRGTHLELVESCASGGTDTRGYLGARVALERFGPETVRGGRTPGSAAGARVFGARGGVGFAARGAAAPALASTPGPVDATLGKARTCGRWGRSASSRASPWNPPFHTQLRGLRGLGRTPCGLSWNARDRDGRRGRQLSGARASESGAGGGRRSSRVARDAGMTRGRR